MEIGVTLVGSVICFFFVVSLLVREGKLIYLQLLFVSMGKLIYLNSDDIFSNMV